MSMPPLKLLMILRHAEALPSDSGGDAARKLSGKGLQDAAALGLLMREKKWLPQHVYCSTTIRTRQTLEQVSAGLGALPTDFEERIYSGGLPDMMDLIRATPPDIHRLLIVGHNPGIHALSVSLAAEGASPLLNQMTMGYAPGSLSVLECPLHDWRMLAPHQNSLVDFVTA